MNNHIIGNALLILGVYFFLLIGIFNSSSLFMSKTEACRRIEFRAKKENKSDVDIDSIYHAKRKKILSSATIKTSIGILLISFGLFLHKKSTNISLLSCGLQIGYWILFSATALYITTEGFTNFITCDFTWLFLFLTAGLTGFYFGYGQLTISQASFLRSVPLILLVSGIGGMASYGPLVFNQVFAVPLRNLLAASLPIGFFSFIAFIDIFLGYGFKVLGNRVFKITPISNKL